MLSAEQRVVTNVSEWVSFPDCRSRARGACCRERREASQHFIDNCFVKIVFCVSVSLRRAVSYNQVRWASAILCRGLLQREERGETPEVCRQSVRLWPRDRRSRGGRHEWSRTRRDDHPSGCPCLTSPAPPSGRVTWVLLCQNIDADTSAFLWHGPQRPWDWRPLKDEWTLFKH